MKANKWVAVLAAGSILAVAAPVSAQFGGLGALKKKLETVAKELEKPKTQPAPTTPPSNSTSSQGGYATPAQSPQLKRNPESAPPISPAPPAVASVPTERPAPPTQQQVAPPEVVATEVWRCIQEPDATPIKIEFRYLKNLNGQRRGYFTQTYAVAYDDEGNLLPQDVEKISGKGLFVSTGASYRLKYDDPEMGRIELGVSRITSDGEIGFVNSRYDDSMLSMMDIQQIVQKFTPEEIRAFEEQSDENPDGGIPMRCNLVKPIYSKYSFEDYAIQAPARFERFMGTKAAAKVTKQESEHGRLRYIKETLENEDPNFAKYYIVAWMGSSFDRSHALIDVRTGNFVNFDIQGDEIGFDNDFIHYVNSKLTISISSNEENDSCFLNYSTWGGKSHLILGSEKIGNATFCRPEAQGSMGLKEGVLQLLEDQIIRGERQVGAIAPVTP